MRHAMCIHVHRAEDLSLDGFVNTFVVIFSKFRAGVPNVYTDIYNPGEQEIELS